MISPTKDNKMINGIEKDEGFIIKSLRLISTTLNSDELSFM